MKKDNLKFVGEGKLVLIRDEKNKVTIPCIQVGEAIFPFGIRSGDPEKNFAGEGMAFAGGGFQNLRLINGVIHEDNSGEQGE